MFLRRRSESFVCLAERESSGKSFQIVGTAWLNSRLAIAVLTCMEGGWLKLQEWTLQEWTTREDGAGVNIAGLSRRDAISQVNHFTATWKYRDYSTAYVEALEESQSNDTGRRGQEVVGRWMCFVQHPHIAETLHLTTSHSSRSRLRSAATSTLIVPATRRRTLGDRALELFAVFRQR